jgi:cation/acetate symporter
MFIMARDITTEGVFAFVIAGALAAALSTVSGLLIIVGTGLVHDLYATLKPELSDDKKLRYSIWAMFIGGIVCTILAIRPPQFILATVMWAFGIAGASFGVPIVMGIWWKRTNKYGAFAGMVTGFLITFIPYLLVEAFGWEPSRILFILYGPLGWGKLFAIALPIVFIVVIIVSWLTEPPPMEVKKQVDMMHGWPDYEERRYNGKLFPVIVIILSILCILLGFTLYDIFSAIG